LAIRRIWFAPSSCRCRTICSTGPATCSRSLGNAKRPLCRPSVASPSTASPALRRSHMWSSAQQNHNHNNNNILHRWERESRLDPPLLLWLETCSNGYRGFRRQIRGLIFFFFFALGGAIEQNIKTYTGYNKNNC